MNPSKHYCQVTIESKHKTNKAILKFLKSAKYKFLTDAGSGVRTKEKLTQNRLAEAFQVLNLDLQGRLHYAPGDSRVHIAEKMMRSLNEHARAEHTIPIPSVPLTSLVSPGELMAMCKNEMKDLTDRKEKQEAEGCSESVASLYDGKSCMGTSIHARVPNSCFL